MTISFTSLTPMITEFLIRGQSTGVMWCWVKTTEYKNNRALKLDSVSYKFNTLLKIVSYKIVYYLQCDGSEGVNWNEVKDSHNS